MSTLEKEAEMLEPQVAHPNGGRRGRRSARAQVADLPQSEPAIVAAMAARQDAPIAAPGEIEGTEFLAWAQRRHDLEMRMTVLLAEYDRLLASLESLLGRLDELVAERAAAEPPIHDETLAPPQLRDALALARERMAARYPGVQDLAERL